MSSSINQLNYRKATFLKSAPTLAQCPPDDAREVAFVGRSNAGKSSALNTLTGSKIARTSKTPGRTQLINYFTVADKVYLVDLPGYGYAKVPEAMKAAWQEHLDEYLSCRKSLVGLVLLVDSRHPPKEFDQMMIEWCAGSGLPLHILLTKSDKLKSGAAKRALSDLEKQVSGIANITVQLFSSLKQTGVDRLSSRLDGWLSPESLAH